MVQLPFWISETHAGFGRCEGVVSLDGTKLAFEFQTKLAGVLKSGVKLVEVPLSEVASIEYKPYFFTARVVIQFKSLRHTQAFPKADGCEVRLEVRRKNRPAADRLVKDAKSILLDSKLNEMLDMTDEAIG